MDPRNARSTLLGHTQNHPYHSITGTSSKLPNFHVCKRTQARETLCAHDPRGQGCATLQTHATLRVSSKFLQIFAQLEIAQMLRRVPSRGHLG